MFTARYELNIYVQFRLTLLSTRLNPSRTANSTEHKSPQPHCCLTGTTRHARCSPLAANPRTEQLTECPHPQRNSHERQFDRTVTVLTHLRRKQSDHAARTTPQDANSSAASCTYDPHYTRHSQIGQQILPGVRMWNISKRHYCSEVLMHQRSLNNLA